jgi:LPXTG-motif cell wall-anchored protein
MGVTGAFASLVVELSEELLGQQTPRESCTYTGATLGLTGTVTLDAQGDPNAVFIFQAASTLITASSSVVALTNGADACNVYWQVGSSATLGTTSTFVGTVLALTSVTATTSATINGQLLARNGAVTLDSNVITNSACGTSTSTTTTTTTQAPTTTTQAPTATTAAAVPSTTVAAGLPRTGRSTVPLTLLASGLVLVGGVFMAARRRNHA